MKKENLSKLKRWKGGGAYGGFIEKEGDDA